MWCRFSRYARPSSAWIAVECPSHPDFTGYDSTSKSPRNGTFQQPEWFSRQLLCTTYSQISHLNPWPKAECATNTRLFHKEQNERPHNKYRISAKQATNPTGVPGPVPAGRTGNRKESQWAHNVIVNSHGRHGQPSCRDWVDQRTCTVKKWMDAWQVTISEWVIANSYMYFVALEESKNEKPAGSYDWVEVSWLPKKNSRGPWT